MTTQQNTDTERLAAIQARADAATEGPWDETWKQIPGVVGYEVSDYGHVRSYFKKGNHREKRAEYPRTLSARIGKTGYPSVSLPTTGNGYATRAIHRLVMLAFVGPAPEGHEVAHLNGDRLDPRLSNLRYVSHVENESHKIEHGTTPTGERNGMSTLLGWQVAEIKYLAGKSVPQGKIAALFGIDQKRVSDILSGRIWPDKEARADIPYLVQRVRDLEATIAKVRGLIRDRSFAESLSRDFEGNPFPQLVDMDELRAILEGSTTDV